MLVKIENIGKVREANVVGDSITTIAGSNGTGKSTVGRVLVTFLNVMRQMDEFLIDKKLTYFFEELQRLQNEPVSNEELDMVKNYMTGLQLRAVDTTVNAMQKFAYWHRFGLDETEMFRYLTEIKDVTPAELLSLAKKYFPYNKFTRIIVGNYS